MSEIPIVAVDVRRTALEPEPRWEYRIVINDLTVQQQGYWPTRYQAVQAGWGVVDQLNLADFGWASTVRPTRPGGQSE